MATAQDTKNEGGALPRLTDELTHEIYTVAALIAAARSQLFEEENSAAPSRDFDKISRVLDVAEGRLIAIAEPTGGAQ
ncbi:MAG: hypothetical protein JNL19_05570 [Burkholderiales bacterium]|nr:hypothetical protein [Burkholderiales bacterium]